MEKENENKEKDKELELDPGLLGQSPAPLFGNTYRSEEDKINDELSKINDSSNNNNNNIDEEKAILIQLMDKTKVRYMLILFKFWF